MKPILMSLMVLLLVGCASVDVPPQLPSQSVLPAADTIKPFHLNPNVEAMATQLHSDYASVPVDVLRVGNEIKIIYPSDLLFGVGGEALLPSSLPLLNTVIERVKLYPGVVLRVDCFTDASGSSEKNTAYSEKRADYVSLYLTSKGVAPANISFKGYGGAYPVADNDSVEGRALNRRVIVTISKIPLPVPQNAG